MPRLRCWSPYGAPPGTTVASCGSASSEPTRTKGASRRGSRASARAPSRAVRVLRADAGTRPARPAGTRRAPRGAADVERLPPGSRARREGGPELREEIRSRRRGAGPRARAQHRPPSWRPPSSRSDTRRPIRPILVDRAGEREEPLRHPSRRRDDDHHHELRLQKEDLDSPDHRRREAEAPTRARAGA